MRLKIIAGLYKGRYFNVPDSDLIRPTTNRVKETLFNILNNIIDFEDIKVLDIYSGSGALGFESLSRGAAEVNFVEKNHVIYTNLEKNIKALDLSGKTKIFKMEAIRFANLFKNQNYDLVLLDPPFFKYDVYEVVKGLIDNKYVNAGGMIIIERSVQTKKDDIENFGTEPFKFIGDTCLYKIEIPNE